jgi:hypothetical protein
MITIPDKMMLAVLLGSREVLVMIIATAIVVFIVCRGKRPKS